MRRSATAALSERGCIFEHAGAIGPLTYEVPNYWEGIDRPSVAASWLSRICVRGASPQTTENAR